MKISYKFAGVGLSALFSLGAGSPSGVCANTLIIAFRTEDATILAADSKVSTAEGLDAGSACKIHITNNFVWATAGILQEPRGPFNLWSNAESAIGVGGSLDEVVSRFELNVVSSLKEFLPRFKVSNPDAYRTVVKGHYPVTTVFFEHNNMLATYFYLPNLESPADIQILRHSCPGADCPAGQAQLIMGNHDAVDAELQRAPDIFKEKGLVGGLEYLTNVQHSAAPESVSAPVSILRIDKSGALEWLQKGYCE